uniref:TAFA chemokine like family member 5, like n=1 Tax=Sinocyclocheilus rhinocerous TaxID=307959 RepID=A0A673KVU7_9TELE
ITFVFHFTTDIFIMSRFLKCMYVCVSSTGQLAVGTCEIVMLNRDSSQPKRTIARQTARCACRRGQIAGTTRARPACVDARIVKSKQWCEMSPCSEGEICGLIFNRSGWTCTKGGGRIKTVTVRHVLNICNISFIHLVDAMLHHSHHLCFISRSIDLH